MMKSRFQIHAAFSVHAWRQKLMIQDSTEQTVLLGAVRSYVPARSAARQKGSCRLRGIAYVYVWLECSYDTSEGHPG
jgi:hypothetical protein